MESNFNNKDFEQFIKQNADQYRMFPSEKVWNGIHNTLHTRRRWYGIGLTLLLLTTGVVTWVMLIGPSGKKDSIASNTTSVAIKKSTQQKNQSLPPVIIVPAKPLSSNAAERNVAIFRDNLFLTPDITAALDNETELLPVIVKNDEIITSVTSAAITQSEVVSAPSYVHVKEKEVEKNNSIPSLTSPSTLPVALIHTDDVYDESTQLKEKLVAKSEENNQLPKDIYPLSIESVVNSYQKITNKKRLSWQIYFLPTVSYRKLVENRDFIANSQQILGSSPLNYVVATDDVNKAVTHKPDIGLELGFNIGYPLGKNIKLTTGLQLNISKYDIKAYRYPGVEQARIALDNNNGYASVSTVESSYRNFENYTKADWLSNFYISVSLPVGLEINVTNNHKATYLGIGGTIQPTYILGDRAYLISTDFKNYAKVPDLTRRWNASTSFEVFAGYTTGKIKWKVGPQVRYQMLSSFEKKYPVKEHLIDFGLKVGVMLK